MEHGTIVDVWGVFLDFQWFEINGRAGIARQLGTQPYSLMGYEERNLKVFLSSSMVEFVEEREAIESELTGLGIPHFVFEHEGATGRSPQELFQKAVTHATVYVGVFGYACGEYTKKEYEQARAQDLTCLLYFHKRDDAERSAELRQFRKELDGVVDVPTRYHFSTSADLIAQMRKDLVRWLDEQAGRAAFVSNPHEHKINIRNNLPVLCDRQDQHDDVRGQILDHFKAVPRRPILLLLPGAKNEGHDHFLTRVGWHSLPKTLAIVPTGARESKQTINVEAIQIHGEIKPHHTEETIRERIAEQLQTHVTDKDEFVAQYIEKKNLDALFIGVKVYGKDWPGDVQPALQLLKKYIVAVPAIPQEVLFGSVVYIIDEPATQNGWGIMKRLSTAMGFAGKSGEQVAQAFQEEISKDLAVQVYALPCLESIAVDHGQNWRGLPEVQAWIKTYRPNSPIRDQDIERIFEESQRVPMNRVYDKLLDLLVQESR